MTLVQYLWGRGRGDQVHTGCISCVGNCIICLVGVRENGCGIKLSKRCVLCRFTTPVFIPYKMSEAADTVIVTVKAATRLIVLMMGASLTSYPIA